MKGREIPIWYALNISCVRVRHNTTHPPVAEALAAELAPLAPALAVPPAPEAPPPGEAVPLLPAGPPEAAVPFPPEPPAAPPGDVLLGQSVRCVKSEDQTDPFVPAPP